MSTDLIRIMALLYRWQPEEIQVLEDELLERRIQAWRTALSEQARQFGCNRAANDPSGGDLRVLRAESGVDAAGIVSTWNRDVERELQRLFDANPGGDRTYYASNMETWADTRNTWKSRQVGLQTVQTTRAYAQSRFREENELRADRFLFVGPPPVCRRCTELFAAGIVDQRFVDRNPVPIHVLCPHEWQLQTAQRLDCRNIWVG